MLGLLVYATTSTDHFASEEMLVSRARNLHGLTRCITGLADEERKIVVELLEARWWDLLVEWYTGRRTHAQLIERIESAIGLLLR